MSRANCETTQDGGGSAPPDSGGQTETFEPQASPEIQVLLLRQLPSGTAKQDIVFLDPSKQTCQIKANLAELYQIPETNIQLIFMGKELATNRDLLQQGVEPLSCIVMRDARLKYT